MAKGQMRSGREPKKPKKSDLLKAKPQAQASPFQQPAPARKPPGAPR